METLFKALADHTRRKILDELSDRNGQTLFELCQRLMVHHRIVSSRQAISQHLALLEEAGLISVKREGRYKFHYINTKPLSAIGQRWSDNNKEQA
jgi:DNA-binding transcriptional ArsR family regulator